MYGSVSKPPLEGRHLLRLFLFLSFPSPSQAVSLITVCVGQQQHQHRLIDSDTSRRVAIVLLH